MSESEDLRVAVVEWEAAFERLIAAREHLKHHYEKPGRALLMKAHEDALSAYSEATEKRLSAEERFLSKE
jgi:hypothetical protein